MSTVPTILQIIPELATGGAERTVIEVAEAVVMAGGRALVVTEGGRLEDELEAVGGELIKMPVASKNPVRIFANVIALRKLIARQGVSLVHARSRAPAWSGLMAARSCSIPFVTTYHGIYNQKGPVKGLYNGVMARGDLVIANSRYTANIIRKRHHTPEAHMRVIPRGVDLARFSPEAISDVRIAMLRQSWGVSNDARIILLAARLTRWKGQHVVVGAAAEIAQMAGLEDVVFVLAGDDQGRSAYRAGLAEQIAAHGLESRVIMPGHCDDVPAALASASLALVSSIEPEAFGRSSAEAQAMGCPVIVSRIGALPETIADGDELGVDEATGWSVAPGDSHAFAKKIATVLNISPKQRQQIQSNARYRIHALFSKEALQKRTLQVYDNLLGSRLASDFSAKFSLIGDSAQ